MLGTKAVVPPRPPDETRTRRRERHASEVEASQGELRNSVAETDRVVDASDKMLRRHREECEDDGE